MSDFFNKVEVDQAGEKDKKERLSRQIPNSENRSHCSSVNRSNKAGDIARRKALAPAFSFSPGIGALSPRPSPSRLEGPIQKISSPSRPGKSAIVSIKLL